MCKNKCASTESIKPCVKYFIRLKNWIKNLKLDYKIGTFFFVDL